MPEDHIYGNMKLYIISENHLVIYHIKKSLRLLQLVFVDDLLEISDDAFVLVVVLGHQVDGLDCIAVEIACDCGASDHALPVETHP